MATFVLGDDDKPKPNETTPVSKVANTIANSIAKVISAPSTTASPTTTQVARQADSDRKASLTGKGGTAGEAASSPVEQRQTQLEDEVAVLKRKLAKDEEQLSKRSATAPAPVVIVVKRPAAVLNVTAAVAATEGVAVGTKNSSTNVSATAAKKTSTAANKTTKTPSSDSNKTSKTVPKPPKAVRAAEAKSAAKGTTIAERSERNHKRAVAAKKIVAAKKTVAANAQSDDDDDDDDAANAQKKSEKAAKKTGATNARKKNEQVHLAAPPPAPPSAAKLRAAAASRGANASETAATRRHEALNNKTAKAKANLVSHTVKSVEHVAPAPNHQKAQLQHSTANKVLTSVAHAAKSGEAHVALAMMKSRPLPATAKHQSTQPQHRAPHKASASALHVAQHVEALAHMAPVAKHAGPVPMTLKHHSAQPQHSASHKASTSALHLAKRVEAPHTTAAPAVEASKLAAKTVKQHRAEPQQSVKHKKAASALHVAKHVEAHTAAAEKASKSALTTAKHQSAPHKALSVRTPEHAPTTVRQMHSTPQRPEPGHVSMPARRRAVMAKQEVQKMQAHAAAHSPQHKAPAVKRVRVSAAQQSAVGMATRTALRAKAHHDSTDYQSTDYRVPFSGLVELRSSTNPPAELQESAAEADAWWMTPAPRSTSEVPTEEPAVHAQPAVALAATPAIEAPATQPSAASATADTKWGWWSSLLSWFTGQTAPAPSKKTAAVRGASFVNVQQRAMRPRIKADPSLTQRAAEDDRVRDVQIEDAWRRQEDYDEGDVERLHHEDEASRVEAEEKAAPQKGRKTALDSESSKISSFWKSLETEDAEIESSMDDKDLNRYESLSKQQADEVTNAAAEAERGARRSGDAAASFLESGHEAPSRDGASLGLQGDRSYGARPIRDSWEEEVKARRAVEDRLQMVQLKARSQRLQGHQKTAM
jgi:hypothetical protein